ncbi:MAG: peptidase M16 [Gammaproteobacteria bacterium RIFCSPHIGHO2_12_FULL_40_19]|nr:MAG: peptidase M16 [Gammaproteobacteria bacterium RIFCSPHIGHO2_12_FULL_40_19]
MRQILLLIILAIFIPSFALASKTEAYQLPNGLKIIVREDHRAPVVESSIWYKVGASYESNGETGISHMLEHMMFQGTTKFGPGVFNQMIGDSGGDNNAITSEDYTVYFETTSPKQLENIFLLEADRMQNLLLDDKAFQTERKVVMEERRMRVDDAPQSMTYERFRATAFVNSPYHHPTIGWMTDIEHYTANDLRRWYDTWYAPNNAVIVIVGDVKADQVLALAKKYFGDIKPKTVPTLKPRNEVRAFGKKEIQVHLPAQLPWLIMGYQVPTSSYALMLCADILSGGQSSRLPTDLIRHNTIAVEAEAEYSRYNLHQTIFLLAGTPTSNHSVLALQKALFQQIQRLQTTLVSTDELNRVKAQLIASKVYQNDSLMRQVFELGVPEMVGLSWRESDQFAEKIQRVTPEDIQRAAKEYFTKENLTVAELVPR